MKITIITAAWNSAATLRDTIESVLAQTYTDWEHIIVDGASTDSTAALVESYRERYAGRLTFISEPDHGIYDAMNKGIAHASGDVIGILNSDDFYADSDVLKDIAQAIEGVDAVYGNLDFVAQNDTTKVVRIWRGSQYPPRGFMKGWHPAHPTFYARKECFEKFGSFDITFNVSADFELMLRFIEKNQIPTKFVNRIFVKMRYGGESTGSIGKIISGNKNVLRAFEKNGLKRPKFYTFRRLAPKVMNLIATELKIKR
jgi:glycosyltransferase involved in cell wall biosynthesis